MEKYWAADDGDKIAGHIMKRVQDQKRYLKDTGMLRTLQKSYDTYYGDFEINELDGSYVAISVNHYASYVRNIHNMVTASRPAWEPKAVNTDLESQGDTTLASGLLDYYMREKHIETKLTDAAQEALYLREGWVSLGWNVSGGEIYGKNPDTGEPIYEGDFDIGQHSIDDITRDIKRKDMNNEWLIIRTYQNKWNLAAKYPQFAEAIVQIPSEEKGDTEFQIYRHGADTVEGCDDLIPVYTLRHDRTDALKSGRMVIVLNDEIKLFDGPLPYRGLYCYPITAGKQAKTAFAHSYLMDLLPVQGVFDSTVSAITTNQAANAVQNFQVPKGASPTVTKLEGMNVVEYDPKAGKLEPMDLLKTAPEVFKFAEFLLDQANLLSNVSMISRGEAPPQMSGTAMALLQQQAIQSTSALQTSFTIALESIGTGLIELLQTFAVAPRVALIAGKAERSLLKEFSGKDLKGIRRVIVDRANPLTKTGAGRMEIANQLLAANQISTPEQYIAVLTTGNLKPLYQRDNSQRLFILAENERLMAGQPAQALLTDDHPQHVLEHSCVLDSPEARENPQVVTATLQHIQEHMNIARGLPPDLAALLKQQSIFQAPPMVPPNGQAQGQPSGTEPLPDISNPTNLPQPAEPPNPNAFGQGV